MSALASFADFYAAANAGRAPLPWQERLCEQVLGTGRWPSEIAIPTGLGKTSCIDVAVYALAAQASMPPGERRGATRIWYVVNRRLLVDVALQHARRLAGLLATPEQAEDGAEVLEGVAKALSSLGALGSEQGPLHVAQLRGGAEIGARSPDPSQPALICATVPMFASRLLFRGFGSSTSMRPIDAAQAGIDTLVLLDEAHLARPLLRLVEACDACDPGNPVGVLGGGRHRPVVVSMSATGEGSDGRFELDERDHSHPLVRRRLDARKPTTLVEVDRKALSGTLAEVVLERCEATTTESVVVFCNTARRAREVERLLARAPKAARAIPEVVLLTGRVRERDATVLRARLLDEEAGVRAGRRREVPRARPLVVVATQTLEVGADLDFDVLVSETASVRALTQRLGRLDRLGERPGAAAVLCHPRDGEDPVYGVEPATVWARLAAADPTSLELGPARVAAVLGEPGDAPARSAELLPEHLLAYAKTSLQEPGEALPELFYAGFEDRYATVALCWRAHLPEDGVRLLPTVREAESIEVPLGEARDALATRGIVTLRRLARDAASLETIAPEALMPGDVVVLPTRAGLYDEHGWNAESTEVVLDVGLLGAGVLPLSMPALTDLLGAVDTPNLAELSVLVGSIATFDGASTDDVGEEELCGQLIEMLRRLPGHPSLEEGEWASFLDRLSPAPARPVGDVSYLFARGDRAGRRSARVRVDAFEELSFEASSIHLEDHLGSVGEAAGRIALTLGLSEELVAAVALAGRAHDLGKGDPRFQRWLDPSGEEGGLLAKSSTRTERIEEGRIASGWPRGGRHEVLSARLLQAFFALEEPGHLDAELVVHLVASHHGYGRPVVPPVDDDAPVRVRARFQEVDVTASGDLGEIDWDQPGRFHRLCEHYGLWGLCLLEAIVRQADHAVSSAVEVA